MNNMQLLSVSANPVTRIIGKPYYDLPSTVKVMKKLYQRSAVDGFEIQNLEEWRREHPPRDDINGHRLNAWEKSPHYTSEEVSKLLLKARVPILSIHANRDVGILLCNEQDINEGKLLIHESLSLAQKVGARVCVFHLWDTWKEDFSITFLHDVLDEISCLYEVSASVENVPTHMEGVTPFDLVKEFESITLDLRWAALYDELEKFEEVKDCITNIHVRGELQGGKWVLNKAPFEVYEALEMIRSWGYSGLITVEPEGGVHNCDWDDLVEALSSLR